VEIQKLAAELSALIDIGRFLLPNREKGTGFGDHKLPVNQGFRHKALDPLVEIYRSIKDCSHTKNVPTARSLFQLRGRFVSKINDLIDPEENIRFVSLTTGKKAV
jgi:hypothetical protein